MTRKKRCGGRISTRFLCLLTTGTLVAGSGSCGSFRDDVVSAVEGATTSIILSGTDAQSAVEAAGRSVAGSLIQLFFDRFRTNGTG